MSAELDLDALEERALVGYGLSWHSAQALIDEVRRLRGELANSAARVDELENTLRQLENGGIEAGYRLAKARVDADLLTVELTEMTQERDAISTVFDAYKGDCDALTAERDELRAVLAPLLENPVVVTSTDGAFCRFCGWTYGDGPTEAHVHDCPTWPTARDRLLGREP